ncbi:MAG: ParB-like nuclease domain-containing protein [Candidatus Lokiarchaeota archaeon]|nr:ParB-like nuclease domain-containing protein [Candidatus Lokiarchaeota archaeon]
MSARDKNEVLSEFKKLLRDVNNFPLAEKVLLANEMKRLLFEMSPLNAEPVDLIQWVPADKVEGNDYNPNKVAPPEMRLLHLSIKEDGYTQPIVAYHDKELDKYVVVDGFHRNRVGKEYEDVAGRIRGYLPVVTIDKPIVERMASTIRHNRARGTHEVRGMADIVAELYLKGVSDKKIAEQLGMEKDEVLKLKQFVGLGDLFKNRDFSKSWI